MTRATSNICRWAIFSMMTVTAFVASPVLAAEVTDKFTPHTEGSTQVVNHSAWTRLLEKYVIASSDGLNRVNYSAFKSGGHAALKDYLAELQKTNPAELSRNEQFAFWANLYNAKTIDIVLDHYPVKSIKDISLEDAGLFDLIKKSVGAGGPWKTPIVSVSGTKLSLDDIEHRILRPVFKDPRVHYAVNCASIGCPNLAREAFTGEKLDAQLNAGARAYINHPRGFSVSGGDVTASSIYSWFKADFGGNAQGVLAHAKTYAAPDLKAKLEAATGISSYSYDWGLNDTTN